MICHELKLIFIHIPRTAGTSFEIAMIGKNWWDISPKTKHLTWQEAKAIYSTYWNDYYKVSITRNPWDWLVSLYFSHSSVRAEHQKISWSDYARAPKLVKHEQPSCIQSEIIGEEVDFILRYESINEDFKRLCSLLKVDKKLPYFSAKSGRMDGERKHYSYYYDIDLKQSVERMFSEDIKRFGYKYEEV